MAGNNKMVYYLVQDIPTRQLENSLSLLDEWKSEPFYDPFDEPTILHLLSMQERNMLNNTSQTVLQNMGDILEERRRIIHDRSIIIRFHNRFRKNTCCIIT
jgi:hypothetical protein